MDVVETAMGFLGSYNIDIQSVSALLLEVINPALEFFVKEEVAPVIALLILLAMVVFFIWFVLKIAVAVIRLRRLNKNFSNWYSTDPEHEFYQNYGAIVDTFSTSFLVRSWSEFEESLIKPKPEKDLVVRNTIRPSVYINRSSANLNFKLFQILPNLFVGVGLLFTFFGLVAALHFTGVAMSNGGSAEAMQGALTNLLAAASLKFWTSIAGLFSSLVLTVTLRYGSSVLDKLFASLCDNLEKGLNFAAQEQLALDQLSELSQQTVALKNFSSDVALALTSNLNAALEPVSTQLSRVADSISGSVGNAVQEAAGNELSGLSDMLQQTQTAILTMRENISDSGQQVSDDLARAASALNEAAESIRLQVKELDDSAVENRLQFAQQVEKQGYEFETRMLEISELISGTMSAVSGELSEVFKGAGDSLQQQIGVGAEAIEGSLATIRDEIDKTIEPLKAKIEAEVERSLVGASSEVSSQILEVGSGLTDNFSSVSNDIQSVFERLETIVESLRMEMRRTANQFETLTPSIETASSHMEGIGKRISDSASDLVLATSPIQDITRSLESGVNELKQSLLEANRGITSSTQTIGDISTQLNRTLEKLQSGWAEYADRFEDIDQDLGLAFEKIIEELQTHIQRVQEFTRNADSRLGDAVVGFSNVVSVMSDIVEESKSH